MAKIDRLTKQAKEHLETDESIIAVVLGQYEGEMFGQDTLRTGIFIATVEKIVLYCKTLFGYELEVFPYSNISSIEMGKGAGGYSIKFFASNNAVRMKWIRTGDVQQFIEYVRSKIEKTTQEDTPTVDIPDQIRKLAELKNQGILTEKEFESKKKELLAKL